MAKKLIFNPTAKELYFSKQDPEDPRLGELFHPLDWAQTGEKLKKPAWVIVGYPDDEGISMNGGRVGAALAPPVIRKYLYKMTPFSRADFQLLDGGDLQCKGLSLPDRHEQAKKSALEIFTSGAKLVTLGGGHDYGYPDAAAFALWCQSQRLRPLVINFDAHLDVRPTDHGFHSGTPFRRLVTEFEELDFLEVGLQRTCNSLSHDEWLQDEGGRRIYIEDFELSGQSLADMVFDELQDWAIRPRPVFISVDMDVFSNAVAPGCSASLGNGLMPFDFFQAFVLLKERLEVKGLGIYEVSPPLDHDDRTSKLAAQVIHRAIFG